MRSTELTGTDTMTSPPEHLSPPRFRPVVGFDPTRTALLVCWLLLLGFAAAFGERSASLGQLEGSIGSGQVRSVVVSGSGLPTDGSGYIGQEVKWRDGFFRQRTEVTMWVGTRPGSDSDDEGAVVHGYDIAPRLRALNPDLSLTRTDLATSSGVVYGWQVPIWAGVATLALILLTLGSLIAGRPTWRATKWAWFWLMATPIGLLAYLVLAGPTPGVPPPRSERPSLRGGWAFVIAMVSTSILPTWWH